MEAITFQPLSPERLVELGDRVVETPGNGATLIYLPARDLASLLMEVWRSRGIRPEAANS